MSLQLPSVIWLEIEWAKKANLLLCGVYREWGTSNEELRVPEQRERLAVLLEQIEQAADTGKPVEVMGHEPGRQQVEREGTSAPPSHGGCGCRTDPIKSFAAHCREHLLCLQKVQEWQTH
jgi:hypothetical protein